MIKTDEFQRVCRLASLMEIKAGMPVFATKTKDEGIELKAGKLITFSVKDGERDYKAAIQSKDIIAVIGAFENDQSDKTGDIQNEPGTETSTQNSYLVNDIPSVLEEKRIITSQDIEAWKKLSVFDRILLFQKTNRNIIKTRRGFLLPEFAGRDKKTLTDENFKMFSYIPANVMKLSANIAFLFEWSAVVESEKYFENEVCVRGYFQVEINGKLYKRPCGGSCIKKGMMDWGDTMQGAISEMEKRGIYDFLHGDVRRGDIE